MGTVALLVANQQMYLHPKIKKGLCDKIPAQSPNEINFMKAIFLSDLQLFSKSSFF